MKSPSRPSNVDALINQKAHVIDEIKPMKYGQVKVEGEIWLAEAQEDIPAGVWVTIKAIKGVRLLVAKE
jgi:membrane protein implicated in regulation of membrane protease activity